MSRKTFSYRPFSMHTIFLLCIVVIVVFSTDVPFSWGKEQPTKGEDSAQYSDNVVRSRTPVFGDFAATDFYDGVVTKIDYTSHPLAADPRVKLALKKAIGHRANFAGHYYVVTFGCGSNCSNSLILDVITGKLFDGISTAGGKLEYRVDSELIFDPEPHYSYVGVQDPNSPKVSKQYFVFHKNAIKLVFEKPCILKPLSARQRSLSIGDLRRLTERTICGD